ncbi:hypothetical protein J3R30DRAFT_3696529 [Lentinula aciculospora]|uniref:ABM domain-containing protein n=1 Tax=Lentinula aciculospora TaxID=153920 RepID=A0A9W9AL12_9AGAR|nr:hypothetical protein J3R30DRAFT_3696529 [Lentinula aciculospora]
MSSSQLPKSTPSGRVMVIATVPVKPEKVQIVQDLLKAAQKRANSDEEPGTLTYRVTRRVNAEGEYLPIFVNIASEEYDSIQGLETHMVGPPLRRLMEAFGDGDVLDGEVDIKFVDGQYPVFQRLLILIYIFVMVTET